MRFYVRKGRWTFYMYVKRCEIMAYCMYDSFISIRFIKIFLLIIHFPWLLQRVRERDFNVGSSSNKITHNGETLLAIISFVYEFWESTITAKMMEGNQIMKLNVCKLRENISHAFSPKESSKQDEKKSFSKESEY